MEETKNNVVVAAAREVKAKITIPDDLILNILCRLPAEVIVKLKCISRTWHSMINRYCIPQISKQESVFALFINYRCSFPIAYSDNQRFLYPKLDSLGFNLMRGFDITDCCNGLLLLRCQFNSDTNRKPYVKAAPYSTVLCNPSTKQYVKLPDPYFQLDRCSIQAALAFDPCVNPRCFKVIQFNFQRDVDPYTCYYYIFSSETWSWTKFKFEFQEHEEDRVRLDEENYWEQKYFVYFDRDVYRLSRETHATHLLKFSVDDVIDSDSRARAIELPSTTQSRYYQCIGVANGSLYYACCDGFKFQDNSCLNIWMLGTGNRDESEWVLKYNVSLQSIAGSQGIHTIYPCAFHPSNSHLTIFLGCNGGAKYPNIHAYNFVTQELQPHRKLFSLKSRVDFAEFFVFPFVRCFLPFPFGKSSLSS